MREWHEKITNQRVKHTNTHTLKRKQNKSEIFSKHATIVMCNAMSVRYYALRMVLVLYYSLVCRFFRMHYILVLLVAPQQQQKKRVKISNLLHAANYESAHRKAWKQEKTAANAKCRSTKHTESNACVHQLKRLPTHCKRWFIALLRAAKGTNENKIIDYRNMGRRGKWH